MLIHFLAPWDPMCSSLSPPPQQTWMEAGIVRRLLCRFLLYKCLSLPPPHHAPFLWQVASTDTEKVFSEFGLEIRIHEQISSSLAINICCSLGPRKNPWVQAVGYQTPANSASSANWAGVREGCGSLQIFPSLWMERATFIQKSKCIIKAFC